MRGDVDVSLFRMDNEHIIGTNESDLLQIYNGNVKIQGNLILKNLNFTEDADISMGDQKFPDFNEFWTKSTDQVNLSQIR